MASPLTDYERRRLENIKRNDEMMAALKIQSRLSDFSSAKRKRNEKTKSYKISPVKKDVKSEEPVVIRRSLRTRGVAPESAGLSPNFLESSVKPPKLGYNNTTTSPCVLGPLGFRESCTNDNMSDVEAFTELILSISSSNVRSIGGARGMADSDSCKVKLEPDNMADSYACKVKLEPDNMADSYACKVKLEPDDKARVVPGMTDSYACKVELEPDDKARVVPGMVDPYACKVELESLSLEPDNIARVVPGRVFVVKFFPTHDLEMVVVGNKFGNVGFWDMKSKDEGSCIHLYRLHSAPVSGILVHPFSMSKVYTSCYNGMVRVMNVDKEVFDLVYSSDDAVFSLAQKPDDVNSIYLGEGRYGVVKMWDVRMGKASASWNLHENRINSIDFNSVNTKMMATSSTDGTACVWDLRKMSATKCVMLNAIEHKQAVHSAYFSPSGTHLATTSSDDNVGVASGKNFEDVSMLSHDNHTGRWISKFRAIWGWNNEHIYVGNMSRGVDVMSVGQKRRVHTLRSEHMTAIPCRFDAHPCKPGVLAGATAGGQVYVWTPAS